MARLLLSDAQWQRIEPLLPGKVSDRGATAKDNRRFVEAVLWIGRTGAPWRDLPPELGDWHNTHVRFSRWAQSGVWERVWAALRAEADFEQVFLDSTAVRAHLHAAGAKKNTAHRLWDALGVALVAKSTVSRTRSATRSASRSHPPTKRTSLRPKPS
jgi:putative transposase